MPPVEGAILDLTAIIVGHYLPPADAAADFDALARECVAELAPAGNDEIGRPPVKRSLEFTRRHPRTFDDRFVISSQETVGLTKFADAQRPEIVFEELARAVLLERHRGKAARTYAF